MRSIRIIFLFLISSHLCTGQDITRKQADSLILAMKDADSDRERIDIYFKLAEFHLYKPGETKADLDSSQQFLHHAEGLIKPGKNTENEGYLLLLKSQHARESGLPKESKAFAEKALALLRTGKNYFRIGKAYFTLSEHYNYNNPEESPEKIRLVELSANAYAKSDDIGQYAYTLTFLADLYQLNEESPKALKKLDSAAMLYKSIGHRDLQGVYALYSSIYYGDKLFRQALHYSLRALQCAQANKDTSVTLCQINNYIGMAYLQSNEFASGIPYFKEALRIAEKYSDNNGSLAIMMNIVHSYVELKKPEDALAFMNTYPQKPTSEPNYIQTPLAWLLIYTQLEQYTKARPYVDEILRWMKQNNTGTRVQSNLYYMIAKFYLEADQYQQARYYVKKLDSTSALSNSAVRRRGNLFLKYRLDKATGNYQAALFNLHEYMKLNDSLFNETSSRQIKQLEIEFETEKRKNEISTLSQKNQTQQNLLDREKLIRNFTMGGIALMLIILALLFRQYRQKQRTNKLIVQKNEQLQHFLNEKEWLVKEIHHRVKNNFHIVSSLLEIQSSYLKNKEALSAIRESQHRIHSMSIIHQKLYQSETLSTIHMPEYIYELVEYLRESYAIRKNISFSLQIENIELDHASAITLGLILNEAITNAIKYAFGPDEDGRISISLSHISDSQLLLSIADNGRGLPTDFDTKIGASMGMELLQGLTDDLGGNFSIETSDGTHIKVLFTYKSISGKEGSYT